MYIHANYRAHFLVNFDTHICVYHLSCEYVVLMFTHICMYVRIYVCMYVRMYVCMYVCSASVRT